MTEEDKVKEEDEVSCLFPRHDRTRRSWFWSYRHREQRLKIPDRKTLTECTSCRGAYIVRWQKATVHGESKNASPRCPHKDRGDIMGWHLLFFLKLRRYSLGGDSGAGGAFYGWRRSFITATPEALRMTALSPSTFMDAAAFKAFRMFISVCMERPILRVTPPSESCRVFPLC